MMKDEVVEIHDKSRMIYSVNSPHNWTMEKNATGLFPCAASAKSLSERIYRPSALSIQFGFVSFCLFLETFVPPRGAHCRFSLCEGCFVASISCFEKKSLYQRSSFSL